MAVSIDLDTGTEAEAAAKAAEEAAAEEAAKAAESDGGSEGEGESAGLDDQTKKIVAAARRAEKNAQRELATAKASLKAIEDAQKTETERANEKALDAELKAHGFRDRAVQAEVKALAAPAFADPEDAAAFLTLADYVDDEGDIDTAAIQADLDALLKRKPHLARLDAKGRPRPDVSQGSGGNARPSAEPADIFASFLKTNLPR